MNESRDYPEGFPRARYCEMCDLWFKLLRSVWCPRCGSMTVKAEKSYEKSHSHRPE